MNAIDRYITVVLSKIYAPARERERIAADLRSHFAEALQAGESPEAAIARMGSPAEVAVEFMAQMELPYAGFWRRLVAFVIDLGLIILVGMVMGILFVVFSNLVPQQPQGAARLLAGALIALCIGCALAAMGVILLYFPILEGRYGRTLGKRLLGLRVLREDGLPIGYKEAFLRRISYYFEVLAIDALFVPFTAKRQLAFDIVAKTVVVQEMN